MTVEQATRDLHEALRQRVLAAELDASVETTALAEYAVQIAIGQLVRASYSAGAASVATVCGHA